MLYVKRPKKSILQQYSNTELKNNEEQDDNLTIDDIVGDAESRNNTSIINVLQSKINNVVLNDNKIDIELNNNNKMDDKVDYSDNEYNGYDIQALQILLNAFIKAPTYTEMKKVLEVDTGNLTHNIIIDNMLSPNYYTNEQQIIYGYILFKNIIDNNRYLEQHKKQLTNIYIKAIKECESQNIKGMYLKIGDSEILKFICEYFFIHRFPLEVQDNFLLQLLNDTELIQYDNHYQEVVDNFINWFNAEENYEHKCNIIDVLLRYASNNIEVQLIYQRFRRNDILQTQMQSVVNTFTYTSDSQNVHDTNLNRNTKNVARQIIEDVNNRKLPSVDVVEFVNTNNIYDEKTDKVLTRVMLDTTLFDENFTAFTLFYAIVQYIANLEDDTIKKEMIKRLKEEIDEMSGMCITGHISRLINVFRGFDDKYCANFDFKSQLKSVILRILHKNIDNEDENIIMGTYDPNYSEYYLTYMVSVINTNLQNLINEYSEEDVTENICSVLEEIYTHKVNFILEKENNGDNGNNNYKINVLK